MTPEGFGTSPGYTPGAAAAPMETVDEARKGPFARNPASAEKRLAVFGLNVVGHRIEHRVVKGTVHRAPGLALRAALGFEGAR